MGKQLIRINRATIRPITGYGSRGFSYEFEVVPVTCACGVTTPSDKLRRPRLDQRPTLCPACGATCDLEFEVLAGIGESN